MSNPALCAPVDVVVVRPAGRLGGANVARTYLQVNRNASKLVYRRR
jgi:hypothetical protein